MMSVLANAARLPAGTPVTLVFDQELSSKTAKPGESVRMHVAHSVWYNNRIAIRAGAKERAVIEHVGKRGVYGKNGTIRLKLMPIMDTSGRHVSLQPRTKGKALAGKKSEEAGAATLGGAILLGPVGLVGGVFIKGKDVHVHVGDKLESEVTD